MLKKRTLAKETWKVRDNRRQWPKNKYERGRHVNDKVSGLSPWLRAESFRPGFSPQGELSRKSRGCVYVQHLFSKLLLDKRNHRVSEPSWSKRNRNLPTTKATLTAGSNVSERACLLNSKSWKKNFFFDYYSQRKICFQVWKIRERAHPDFFNDIIS